MTAKERKAARDEIVRAAILEVLHGTDLSDDEIERLIPYSFIVIERQRRVLVKQGLVEATGEKRLFKSTHRLTGRA